MATNQNPTDLNLGGRAFPLFQKRVIIGEPGWFPDIRYVFIWRLHPSLVVVAACFVVGSNFKVWSSKARTTRLSSRLAPAYRDRLLETEPSASKRPNQPNLNPTARLNRTLQKSKETASEKKKHPPSSRRQRKKMASIPSSPAGVRVCHRSRLAASLTFPLRARPLLQLGCCGASYS